MSVAVRPMRPDDAAEVAELTTQLGYPSGRSDIERRLAGIDGNDDALLVAELDGAVVGWIHMRVVRLLEIDTLAEIWGLVVDEDARGRGVGAALIAAGERWAAERGMAAIQVRSNVVRERAHRFYQREGYEVVKTSFTMRKALPR